MFANCKNSKKQGDLGLATAIRYFSSVGATVLIPLTDSQDYDLVVEGTDSKLYKVQVKTTDYLEKSGGYTVGLKQQGGNSKHNYIHKTADQICYDLLFVLTGDGAEYIIPKEDIKSIRSSITLGTKYNKYKVNG